MSKMNFKGFTLTVIMAAALALSSGCAPAGFNLPVPAGLQTTAETPALTITAAVPETEVINLEWGKAAPVSTIQALPDMVSVVTKVRPSVVSIDVKTTAHNIFNQSYVSDGSGSGWIIDPDGIIVTNNHVVEDASEITLTLADGRTFPSVSVSTDAVSDLAINKINATGLPAADLGDSTQLQVGQVVAAIGNAMGEGISMTGGWVSQLGGSMTNEEGITLYNLIKTDAAINPGNSGGPLVNTAGEVIGITSAKLVGSSIEGVGYAISVETALPIIHDLVTKGYTTRPWFGLSMQTVNASVAARYLLTVSQGAMITRVSTGSPAALAGLKTGDVLINIGGQEIKSTEDATQAIRGSDIGQAISVQYYRRNGLYTTSVTPTEASG